MHRYCKNIILAFVFTAGISFHAGAQQTIISGTVTDASTGQAMPYVNVYFKGTAIGTTTDLGGQYSLKTFMPSDSIVASFIGYHTQAYPINRAVAQVINFQLEAMSTTLPEFEVIPEERWVDLLMRRVIKNKDLNNPDQIRAYQCEVYNKVQIDVNNIDDKFKERKIVRPIDFVFENLDTSDLNQKVYLPALISESMSDYYFRKSPRATREVIKASQITSRVARGDFLK